MLCRFVEYNQTQFCLRDKIGRHVLLDIISRRPPWIVALCFPFVAQHVVSIAVEAHADRASFQLGPMISEDGTRRPSNDTSSRPCRARTRDTHLSGSARQRRAFDKRLLYSTQSLLLQLRLALTWLPETSSSYSLLSWRRRSGEPRDFIACLSQVCFRAISPVLCSSMELAIICLQKFIKSSHVYTKCRRTLCAVDKAAVYRTRSL